MGSLKTTGYILAEDLEAEIGDGWQSPQRTGVTSRFSSEASLYLQPDGLF